MLRRMLPVSTLTQFFAVGTNQLRFAARSATVLPSRLVVLGMLPIARSCVICWLLVYALIQSTASDLFAPTGTASSEPPRNPGIACPLVRLGITNCAVEPLYLSPTQ